MRASHFGLGPGMAARKAAASICAAGAASVVADTVAPAELNAQKGSALAAQAAHSREQCERRVPATTSGADMAPLALQDLLALEVNVLSRTHGDDRPGRSFCIRWGQVRELPDLEAVRIFAEQVGATRA